MNFAAFHSYFISVCFTLTFSENVFVSFCFDPSIFQLICRQAALYSIVQIFL